MFQRTLAVAAVAVVLTACGGGGDDSADTVAPDTPEASGGDTVAPDDTVTTGTPTSDAPTTDAPSNDFTPGGISFRLLNLLDEPVDLYVRTTGLIEAYSVQPGLAAGELSDLHAPPTDGAFIVTTAGAGDAECVIECPHFLVELTASAPEGDVRTVVLYPAPEGDPFDEAGTPVSFDLWENPTPERLGSSNSMPAADPAVAQIVTIAVALNGADFGLRLADEGTPGCQESSLAGVLVGGNQTPVFTHDGSGMSITLHDNNDRECAEAPVGGPFAVGGAAGSRTHLILTGAPGDMDAIVLPFVGDPETTGDETTGDETTDDETTGDENRESAIEQMTPEVETGLGVPAEQSACVAELLVDAIGPENLLDESGTLIDLDTLGTEFQGPAENALVESVEVCGLDPAMFGG
jgi:hypothetical protein